MWILWTSLGIFLVGLIVAFVLLTLRVKRKFNDAVKPMADKAQLLLDSMGKMDNSRQYAELYAMLGDDSASKVLRGKLDSLQSSTNELCAAFDKSKADFLDTLHQVHANGSDKRISHAFYIETGRAKMLHRLINEYRDHSFRQLPPERQDSSAFMIDPLDGLQQILPGFMKNTMNWERLYFDQPCQAVMSSFNTHHMNIRMYEQRLLQAYREEIYAHPVSPKADTVH